MLASSESQPKSFVETSPFPRQFTIGGAFHSGVEVFGNEWSYGKRGVTCQPPRTAEDHVYRCSNLAANGPRMDNDRKDTIVIYSENEDDERDDPDDQDEDHYDGNDLIIMIHDSCLLLAKG